MTWTGERADRLPPNWQTIRRRILRRDNGACQIAGPRCIAVATDVDHITPGDNHRPGNLQAACKPCHADKSSAEGVQARGAGPLRWLAPEDHPGDT